MLFRAAGILTWQAFWFMILQGVSLACWAVSLFVINFVALGVSALDPTTDDYRNGLLHAQAHCFITISCMQLAMALSSRSLPLSLFRQPLFNNPHLLVGILISFTLLVACMYIPGWNTVFDQYPMNGYDWVITFAYVCVHLATVEALKYCLRHNFFRPAPLNVDPLKKVWYTG